MSNLTEKLQTALQNHQKGIQDVLSQEMSLYFYAHFLAEFPEKEKQVSLVLANVFKETVRNLEELFLEVFYTQGERISEEELQGLRATLQTYIHEQLQSTEQKLWDRVAWLERLKE